MNTQPHNAENGETQSNWEIETDKLKKEAVKIIDGFDDFDKKHIPVGDHNWQDGYINGYIVGKRSGLCTPYSKYTPEQVRIALNEICHVLRPEFSEHQIETFKNLFLGELTNVKRK